MCYNLEKQGEKKRMTNYVNDFIKEILDYSQSKDWKTAVLEWEVVGCVEDTKRRESCICGKEKLRYLFEIRNTKTNQTIFPIGSSCIKKFERHELDEKVDIYKQMAKLMQKLQKNEHIMFNSENFSKKLLAYFLRHGAFKPNKFNNYRAIDDFKFMTDMFNKRTALTEKQQKKVNAIIFYSIRPFLEQQLKVQSQVAISNHNAKTANASTETPVQKTARRKFRVRDDDLQA